MNEQTKTGTIKAVRLTDGYGFIAVTGGGPDAFFHKSGLGPSLEFDETLLELSVEFDLVEKNGRPRAENVRAAR